MAAYSIFIFLATLSLVCYSIKKIIYIAHKKHLFDEPTELRKIHKTKIPNLGGVAIFATMMVPCCLFISLANIPHLNYIIFAFLIIFILGITDDLVGVNPTKKIIAQLIAALTLTTIAGCRLTSFYGLGGFNEMPELLSIFISTAFIIFLVNAFNLIDGINCLAGSLGLLACLFFTFYFFKLGQPGLLYIAIAMCGCLLGFLYFNHTPAKIFMGDTGSMFIGLMIAFLSINFIEINKTVTLNYVAPLVKSAPALVFGLLIIPIFDTVRIFLLRVLKRKSPFEADSNHIHHRLIDIGLSHVEASFILLMANVASLLLVSFFSHLKMEQLFLLIILFALSLNGLLTYLHTKKTSAIKKSQEPFFYSLPKKIVNTSDTTLLK